MLEGKELILATKPYAKEILWKSWLYSMSTLAIVIAFMFGMYLLDNIYLRMLCSLGTGLTMVRMFVIYHDHQHHAILHQSPLGNVIFTLWGIYMLTPTSIWKRSHDYHHNHNSKLFSASIGSFPILTKDKFLKISKLQQRAYLAVRSPLSIIFGYFSMFIYGMSYQSFTSSPRRHWDSLVALVVHVTIAVLIFVFYGWFTFVLFLFPFFFSFMMGAYLFYAQHNFPGVTFKENIEWSYEHAALESSSFMKMNFFWRWVTANIGFHHIHHINSKIPFYRLPEVMKAFPELQQPKVTTLNPSDIVACFKLKLWDPVRNKMISRAEIYQPA